MVEIKLYMVFFGGLFVGAIIGAWLIIKADSESGPKF
jgi:hypothetical protein